MIARLGARLNDVMKRCMPDPFIFALLLTLLTILLAWTLTPASLGNVLVFWKGTNWRNQGAGEAGFWSFLLFGMQMCLILVTGHALATAPPVRRLLLKLASLPRSSGSGAALVSLAAMLAALINWGFGLIVGAVLAREVAIAAKKRGLAFHYPLLGAAGYMGLMIWHGGFSGSAPLDVAGNGISIAGVVHKLPITAMLLSPANLVLNAVLLVTVPLLFRVMAPKTDIVEIESVEAPASRPAEAGWLERSPLLSILFGGLGLGIVGWDVAKHGAKYFDIYSVPFLFLFLAMLLYWRPASLLAAVEEGAKGCGGIILQFPFYAGIYGIMMGSGLHEVMSGWCRSSAEWTASATGLSPGRVFPVLVFFAACLLNMFIPSGGGQWKIQGPVVCQAGEQMGVPLDRTVMAVAYGDELTNMLQPFWALALLGITGLKARQIMGYSAAVMLLVIPIFVAAMMIF